MYPKPTDPLYSSGPLIAPRTADDSALAPYEQFTLTPMSPTIGARIDGVQIGGELTEPVMAELRRALAEWKVLVFGDQDTDREGQRRFASRWGEVVGHPFTALKVSRGQTDVNVATLQSDSQRRAIENNWHNDVTWHEHPSFGAVLRAVEVPPVGGDTIWADTGAAYDTLPDSVKARIDHLSAVHDWIQSEEFGQRMSPEELERFRPMFPPVEHPVVRVIPETGRRVLFVNTIFTDRIVGVSQEESDEILAMLYRHIHRPEFQVRLQWRTNTVAIWDNRTCQHYAVSDYYPNKRVMDRISIGGDRPVGVSG